MGAKLKKSILIIGSGGREHAIGWKFREDSKNNNYEVDLFFSPGNAGTSKIGTNIDFNNFEEIKNFALNNSIDLTFVGPEVELSEGIVDLFEANDLRIFGPDKKAAQLEASKSFAKDFMAKYNVKTAEYKNFRGPMLAKEYLKEVEFPIVVKASGLAAGKGVIICKDFDEAVEAIEQIMDKKIFGEEAGKEIVIEEFLEGFEVSILSVFNGKQIYPFISSKDHKKIGEKETGLNTGGMGVIAPNPLFIQNHSEAFQQNILEPTLKGLISENLIFSGIIFFGLMITEKGVYLLEYNLRMGDPETQAVLPLLESDLFEVIDKAIDQEDINLKWKNEASCCVVMVSGGYPGNYDKGYEIKGLERVECPYFIAGAIDSKDKVVTSGGRVINIVGIGKDLESAREQAYNNVPKVSFDYNYYRKDIGII